ncbi:MAG: biopolymer transporter ExbD [Aureispira sp.]|nr:biopolymer transporter ExbD [Aureispira sp.]
MVMIGKKRKLPKLGAGSMADVAFLLLIFFLVTTTIQSDAGIMSLLPPYQEDKTKREIPRRQVLDIQINANDELLVRGETMELNKLRAFAKEFILNQDKKEIWPSTPKKAVVSLINDKGTSYKKYLGTYNELKAAYRELWDDIAIQKWNAKYKDLLPEQRKEVRQEIPLVISEAEPTDFDKG